MAEIARKQGRPRKADGPGFPQGEVERLLVHGEVVDHGTEGTEIRYPSYRELASRYGVSPKRISNFAKQQNCLGRREEATRRLSARVDEKVIEMRAKAIAVSTADEIRIIDTYILGFEKAMAEDRVRFDDPGYFNQMVRLKQFKLGGPDSRPEVRGMPTLEEMQVRHQAMLKRLQESTPAMRGVVVREVVEETTVVGKLSVSADSERLHGLSPGASSCEPAREVGSGLENGDNGA